MKGFLFTILLSAFCMGQTTYAPPGKYFLILTFNQPMDSVSLSKKSNYKVFDQNMNELEVLNLATMHQRDTEVLIDSSVLLLVNAPNYKTNYIVRVDSVYGKNGLLIDKGKSSMWYYFDGYDPNSTKPYLILK